MIHNRLYKSMSRERQVITISPLIQITLYLLLSATVTSQAFVESSLHDESDTPIGSLLSQHFNNDKDGFAIDETIEELPNSEDEEPTFPLPGVGSSKYGFTDSNPPQVSRANVDEHFKKGCPSTFFTCANLECISAKWRCDGHYDCDDLSDEANCTSSAASFISKLPTQVNQSSSKASQNKSAKAPQISSSDTSTELLTFNSSVEPLMLYSTGLQVRGYWMESRILFEVVGKGGAQTIKNAPMPSITQALSIFFDMFSMDRASRPVQPTHGTADDLSMVKPRSTIVGVDMDPRSKEVYWVELGKDPGVFSTMLEDIEAPISTRQRRQFSKYGTVVDSGLLSPEDIALDTLAENIYITDAGLPAVVVCSLKLNQCRVLFRDNLHKPRAIIVDSSTGWLTYTDWGDHPGIFVASMDGSRRETLIDSDVVWPNGLATDYSNDHLYWTDARLKKIERIHLVSKKRQVIVKENAENPFSIAVFEDRIFWSDWSGSDIRSCDKNTGGHIKKIMKADSLYGIHIYHPEIYKSSYEHSNPCWSKRCSHMCLLRPSSNKYAERHESVLSASCACPDPMVLGDGNRCVDEHISFVLIAVRYGVAQLFPDRIGVHTIERIIHTHEHQIQDMAPDWVNRRLFMYDLVNSHLIALHLTNRSTEFIVSVDAPIVDKSDDKNKDQKKNQTKLKVPSPAAPQPSMPAVRSLVHDPISDNLYWLDPNKNSLMMASVEGHFQKVLRSNLDHPISMVLDTVKRVFYIALPHRIIRTDMMADERSDTLIISADIHTPVAMHLDNSANRRRLYWADSFYGTIESVDLGIKSSGIRSGSRKQWLTRLGTIVSFTVDRRSLLWTIENGDYVYKAEVLDDACSSESSRARAMLGSPVMPAETTPVTLRLPFASNRFIRMFSIDPMHSLLNFEPQLPMHPSVNTVSSTTSTSTTTEPVPFHVDTHNPKTVPQPSAAALSSAHQHLGHLGANKAELMMIRDELSGKKTEASALVNEPEQGASMVWLIVLLLLLSITGLITLISLLVLHKQGRLPRQVSQLSVNFVSHATGQRGTTASGKDDAMLLLDTDA